MVQISVKKNICVFLLTWNFKIWMVDTVGKYFLFCLKFLKGRQYGPIWKFPKDNEKS